MQRYKESASSRVYYRSMFGENRELAIQRDGEKCVSCGMTREEHQAKYGRDITVDHIDGNGRNNSPETRNNDLSNLQTLCLPCHGRKDIARRANEDGFRKLTKERVGFIKTALANGVSGASLARKFGLDPKTIWRIKNNVGY